MLSLQDCPLNETWWGWGEGWRPGRILSSVVLTGLTATGVVNLCCPHWWLRQQAFPSLKKQNKTKEKTTKKLKSQQEKFSQENGHFILHTLV